jgi:hypothetical protein
MDLHALHVEKDSAVRFVTNDLAGVDRVAWGAEVTNWRAKVRFVAARFDGRITGL